MHESRIKYLLRRGMKELDVMFTRYYEHHYSTASTEDRAVFLELLDGPQEPDIWAWAMGFDTPPERYAAVIRAFQQYL